MMIIMCLASFQNRDFLLKRNSWARRNMKKPTQRISRVTWVRKTFYKSKDADQGSAYRDVERERKERSISCWLLKNSQRKDDPKSNVEDACEPPTLIGGVHVDCRHCWLKFHVSSRSGIIQIGSGKEDLELAKLISTLVIFVAFLFLVWRCKNLLGLYISSILWGFHFMIEHF